VAVSHVGKIGHVDESGVYSKKGDIGHIVYGPYWKLPPGTYEATLTIEKSDSDEDAESNVLGVVDITVVGCKVGARKILARQSRLAPSRNARAVVFKSGSGNARHKKGVYRRGPLRIESLCTVGISAAQFRDE
jgi:hypothetical protein